MTVPQRDLAGSARTSLSDGVGPVAQDSSGAQVKSMRSTDGSKTGFTRAEINEVTIVEQKTGQLKDFSMLAMVGLAYAILNSWVAMAASLNLSLPSGGPVATLWGLVISAIGNISMAASLAEICHVFPSSGGPYHWSAILSPPRYANAISWCCGWFAWAGWTALVATTGSLAGGLLTGMYALAHPDYEVKDWQIFVIYLGYILIATVINLYGSRLLPLVNSAAIIWSLAGALIIIITCLACASPNYQTGTFVFGTYLNQSGWNNGVAYILGLLQSSFGLIGIDALSHMVEEVPQPHINIPNAMLLAVTIGASSSFVVLVCLLFVMKDYDAVVSSAAGSLLEILYQATGNVAGAICLQVFPLVAMEFAAQGILCACSRMTHAFARDHGLPFSKFFSKLNPRTGVPDRAVILTSVLVIIFGLIYLGSSSALNAILSSSVVFLNVSYCIPIALLLFRGRHLLRPESFPEPTWTLGPILGPVANSIALAFTVFTTVFFLFPPDLPVTPSNMNYAVAVFGIVFIFSALTWFVQGRHTFTGPRDLGGLFELARAEVDRGEIHPKSHPHSRSSSHHRGHGHGHGRDEEKTEA